jgi:hypothetical protein
MKSSALQTIEGQLPLLTTDEKLCLIEQLATRLRNPMLDADFAAEMEAMANDTDIQREIREIQQEFAVADGDGLQEL